MAPICHGMFKVYLYVLDQCIRIVETLLQNINKQMSFTQFCKQHVKIRYTSELELI